MGQDGQDMYSTIRVDKQPICCGYLDCVSVVEVPEPLVLQLSLLAVAGIKEKLLGKSGTKESVWGDPERFATYHFAMFWRK